VAMDEFHGRRRNQPTSGEAFEILRFAERHGLTAEEAYRIFRRAREGNASDSLRGHASPSSRPPEIPQRIWEGCGERPGSCKSLLPMRASS
jgi:hypothetical protein